MTIGKAFTDPHRYTCAIIFYGATGEEDRSALGLNISRITGTGIKETVTDLIGKTSKWPDSDEAMRLAQKWMVICDECGIEDDFNYNNLKRWTSDPPVQSKAGSANLSQTIIGISNKLEFAVKAAINNSIGRRSVIYGMDKKLGKPDPFP